MNLFELKTDPKAELAGQWIKWPDPKSNAEFLIAALNNEKYKRKMFKLSRARIQADRKYREDPIAWEETETEVMATTILLNWRGEVYLRRAGEAVEFSKEAAIEALGIPDFRNWVKEEATRLENYQKNGEAASTAALKSGTAVVSEIPEPGE